MSFLLAQLRQMPLLDPLNDRQLADHVDQWRWFSIPSGKTLVYQGEEATALYLVVSGVLAVVIRDADGGGRHVAWIGAGELVGEMAVMTGDRRTADVIALRDTSVLEISKEDFHRLTDEVPETLRIVTNQLSSRLKRATRRRVRPLPTKVLAILPLSENAPAVALAKRLSDYLEKPDTLPLQFLELKSLAQAMPDYPLVRVVDHQAAMQSETWFSELERQCHIVICIGDIKHPTWSHFCWRQADHVLLVTRPETPPHDMAKTLVQRRNIVRRPVDLVTIQDENADMPAPASADCDQFEPDLRLHLRLQRHDDIARLARIATNQAIGLVLSGGGARGYAHIGVVQALREIGLPIDLVGGTSFGAIVGAGLAYGWSDPELKRHFEAAFANDPPVNDYTFPIVSLIKGKKVDRRLQRHFGDGLIENLWRPYFCTSANLTTGLQHRHLQGPVVKAVRASVAIPGLLPPVSHGRELLVDGAILNNLPVDIMNNWGRGPIIAVDVAQDRALSAEFDAIEKASFWSIFRRNTRKTPGIVALLLRAATMGGDVNTAQTKQLASWVITPHLENIGLQDWRAFDASVAAGYDHTRKLLEKRQKTGIPDVDDTLVTAL